MGIESYTDECSRPGPRDTKQVPMQELKILEPKRHLWSGQGVVAREGKLLKTQTLETESYLVGGRSKKKQMINTYFQKIKSTVWLRRKAQGRVCSQDDSLTRLRETGSQSLL